MESHVEPASETHGKLVSRLSPDPELESYNASGDGHASHVQHVAMIFDAGRVLTLTLTPTPTPTPTLTLTLTLTLPLTLPPDPDQVDAARSFLKSLRHFSHHSVVAHLFVTADIKAHLKADKHLRPSAKGVKGHGAFQVHHHP